MQNPIITLKTSHFDASQLSVTSLDAYEAVNFPFHCRVKCLSETEMLADEFLNLPACVSIERAGQVRYFHGLVCEVLTEGRDSKNRFRYILHLAPNLWYLNEAKDCQIFHNQTVPQILQTILQRHGIHNAKFNHLLADYQPMEYCVQYQETLLQFMTRLMEAFGIYYFFEHTPQTHYIVFADHPATWRRFDKKVLLANTAQNDMHLKQWLPVYEPMLANWVTRDYHFPVPDMDLTAKAECREPAFVTDPCQQVEYYEYPGNYVSLAEGTKKIMQRAKSKFVANEDIFAEGDVVGLTVGQQFQLQDASLKKADGHYAILAIHHQAQQSADKAASHAATKVAEISNKDFWIPRSSRGMTDDGDSITDGVTNTQTIRDHLQQMQQREWDEPTLAELYPLPKPDWVLSDEERAHQQQNKNTNFYQQTLKVIPATLRYYPPQITAKPKMPGVQTAVVVGPEENNIYTDHYGRIKAKFHWEKNPDCTTSQSSAKDADRHSCWMRVGQLTAGPEWGTQHLPRPGQEIVVMFDHGDPDKPLAVGALNNANNPPPFALPGQQARSGFRTHTIGENKDNLGHEFIFDDTPGAENITIKSSRDLTRLIKDSETMTVGTDHTLVIEGDALTQVLNGSSIHTAGQSIELVAGDSSILITANGIEMNSPLIRFDESGAGGSQGSMHNAGNATTATSILQQTGTDAINQPSTASSHTSSTNNKKVSSQQEQQNYAIKMIAAFNNKPNNGIEIKNQALAISTANQLPVTYEIAGQSITIDKTGKAVFLYPQPGSVINGKIQTDTCNVSLNNDIIQTQLAKQTPKNQPPWQYAPIDLPKNPCAKPQDPDEQHTIKITTLWPPITKNYRQAAETPDSDLLSQEDINYYKSQGNATIFIHGFNVTAGEFSQQITDLGTVYQDIKFDGRNATTYRDIESVQAHFPGGTIPLDGPKEISDFKHKLNGTGDHNWWLYMEDNLNRATNQFDRKNYLYYTRTINIAWDGNPDYVFNYIEAEQPAVTAGKRLAKLISQLKQHNITVNIIAHSLGNSVLIHAMNELGKQGNSNAIEHAFFWEAAIPNNALSNRGITTPYTQLDQAEKQHIQQQQQNSWWYLPYAHTAAKNITVLYSNNDNVLGPIPLNQRNQAQIDKDKPFWGELVPALFIQALNLKSLYDAACWVGVPVTELLNRDNQAKIYQQWLKQHPNIRNKNGQPFPQSFEEQIENDRLENKELFNKIEANLKKAQIWINSNITESNASQFEKSLVEDVNEALVHLGYLKYLISMIKPVRKVVIDMAMSIPVVEGALTLINTMFVDGEFVPRVAMGYEGPDMQDQFLNKLVEQGKIKRVNQTPWLFSHSGMKIPSKALMEHVYHNAIIEAKGMKFGCYKKIGLGNEDE